MLKKTMTTALIIATIALSAQTKMKKACIKMEKDENGMVTKIDTCIMATTDEELQQKINALGLGDLPEVPPIPEIGGVPPVPSVPPVPGVEGTSKEITCTKVIIVDDGEAEGKSGGKNTSPRKQVSVVSSGAGEEAEVVMIDGDGNVMKTRSGSDKDNNAVIKKLNPGEKMDPEIEKIMKEHGIDMKDGEAHKIIIKNNDHKNGNENKEIKVFVFNKIEVKNLSVEDKKALPAIANSTIEKSSPMTNFTMAPNPTDDACTFSYKTNSKEPLQINIYDANGKTVYNEIDKNVNEQINKTVSLKEFGKGIYFVHLTQGKSSEVRKVIVK
jgi:hypothetical protein